MSPGKGFAFLRLRIAIAAVAILAQMSCSVPRGPRQKADPEEGGQPFAFIALGDIHFDRLEHHDLEQVERKHGADDIRQIQNYSRLTETVLPKTFAELREVAAASWPRVAFVAQIGDLVEGLCGNPELAEKQCEDAITFVRRADLGVPFLITKGNHDVTGDGAPEAYNRIILPFLSEQVRRPLKTASFAYEHGQALFAFFDAYSRDSLDWLEHTLAARHARHVFVLIHPPVVPIGARSTWHIYSRPAQQAQRSRLLNLLGKHRAIVLTAHLHKYGAVVRGTDEGRFLQLSLNSVISSPDTRPDSEVAGVGRYGPDLVTLEPRYQPETEAQRRESLRAEAPFIEFFQYADAPGYAVITVRGPDVQVQIYTGLGRRLWKTLNISGGGVRED